MILNIDMNLYDETFEIQKNKKFFETNLNKNSLEYIKSIIV